MIRPALALLAAAASTTACAQDEAGQAPAEAPEAPSDEEIFTAAGFTFSDGAWRKCGDPGTPSYGPGAIAEQGDFNADGQPDAIVTEGGTYCFGMTGTGYTLVSRRADGSWVRMAEDIGIPSFLDTTGADGWPDIEVGGPGFCFPVIRWDGKQYAYQRAQYDGQPCEP